MSKRALLALLVIALIAVRLLTAAIVLGANVYFVTSAKGVNAP